jgi:2,3-bisphosphoglycerate-independent phosphoglycerate mutase
MKYLMLICEGMADEPIEEIGGRTPLEVAKKPFIDQLAKKSRVGTALFVPAPLPVASDVACMSLLGFDPAEFYTGIAPLEALAMGVPQNDHQVAFRCDLVTVADEVLMDTSASYITPKESRILVEELNRRLSDEKVRFFAGEGYKNILLINDPERADRLDALESVGPRGLVGQKFTKHLPKGPGADFLTALMDRSKEILDSHEINRVRIDLNENPANMIWPWGQGKKPKMPGFRQHAGLDGAVVSSSDYVRGLGRALGMETGKGLEESLAENDLVFVYLEASGDLYKKYDWKDKIKFIEEFDASVVGHAVRLAEGHPDLRILVSTDTTSSTARRALLRGHVPYLIHGSGVEAEGAGPFNEKAAALSQPALDRGHHLMESFLKK